jgi:hypothetical protein
VAPTSEHGNEASYSIKGVEFLDQLSDYHLLKKHSAVRSYLKVREKSEILNLSVTFLWPAKRSHEIFKREDTVTFTGGSKTFS